MLNCFTMFPNIFMDNDTIRQGIAEPEKVKSSDNNDGSLIYEQRASNWNVLSLQSGSDSTSLTTVNWEAKDDASLAVPSVSEVSEQAQCSSFGCYYDAYLTKQPGEQTTRWLPAHHASSKPHPLLALLRHDWWPATTKGCHSHNYVTSPAKMKTLGRRETPPSPLNYSRAAQVV